MIHVHTFNDLSEANLAPTWGVRYGLKKRDDVFRHSNPYRTMALDDHFGQYAQVPNPPEGNREHKQITIDKIYWHGSKEAPVQTREAKGGGVPSGAGRLWLHGEEWLEDAGDYLQYKLFLGRADKDFVLRAKGHEEVECRLPGSTSPYGRRRSATWSLSFRPPSTPRWPRGSPIRSTP